MDLRKAAIILVISVLFSILVFATIDAVYPDPKYEDFCETKPYYPYITKDLERQNVNCSEIVVLPSFQEECSDAGGYIRYEYDEYGCEIDYECDTCQKGYDDARKKYNFVHFIISAITALIAIAIGLYLPTTNELNSWVGTGFMLGGLFVLFFSTARTYDDLHRLLRPLVIFFELVIVIYISYRKLGIKKKLARR